MTATILQFTPMARLDSPPNRIREHRLAAGMTQEELADAIGVKQNLISRMERGSNDVTVARLRQIGRVLKTDVGQLLATEDNHHGLSEDGISVLREMETRPELATALRSVAETMRGFVPQPAATEADIVPMRAPRRR